MESSNVIPTFGLGWNPVMWHFKFSSLVFSHYSTCFSALNAQWNWEILVEFNLATSEVERIGHD